MKVVRVVNHWELHQVSSLVALRVARVDSRHCVQGLVQVTHIVYEETESD